MIPNISSAQLRRAAQIKEKIESLQNDLAKLLGNGSVETKTAAPAQSAAKPARKRQLSAEGRARIIEAQKRRWAKKKAK